MQQAAPRLHLQSHAILARNFSSWNNKPNMSWELAKALKILPHIK
jgi:hypothetical protein